MSAPNESDPAGPAGERTKAALRAQIRAARRGRMASAEAVSSAFAASCAHLGFSLDEAAVVLGYAALPGEPDLTTTLEGLASSGVPVLLPVSTAGEPLAFGRLHGRIADLPQGLWGIREPDDSAPAAEAIAQAAYRSGPVVVLAPGLAFGSGGERLGNGGGFYDRTFGPHGAVPRDLPDAAARRVRTVGVCWADEVGAPVAAESWDLRVDAVCGVPFAS